jgi:hypothetical protein
MQARRVNGMESKSTIQSQLQAALTWSESNPLKATVLQACNRALSRIEREEQRVERERVAKEIRLQRMTAFNALPWYRKLFTSKP